MVKIRLTRTGRKDLPTYRVVVLPQRAKRDTKYIEDLGFYHPVDKKIRINKERAEYWLSVGAQPSNTVKNLLIKEKIVKAPKNKKEFKKKPGKKAQERAEAAEK